MSVEMRVDINSTKTGLVIKCPVFANEIVRSLPSRNFDPRYKVWRAPLVRMNAEHILNNWLNINNVILGDGVVDALKSAIDGVAINREKFPECYPFKTEPFKHQRDALDYLWNLRVGALFAEQGTGKTKVAIDKISMLSAMDKIKGVCIVCPTPLRTTWVDEFKTHCPINYETFVVRDTSKKSFEKQAKDFIDSYTQGILKVWIVGYDVLSVKGSKGIKATQDFLSNFDCLMVLDESHNIKSPDANRTKTVVEMGKSVKYKLIMTGTPISHNIIDLYSQYKFLDDNIIGIGSFSAFKARYIVFGGFENKQVVGFQNTDELLSLVKPYTFKITKKEAGLNLPDKLYTTRYITMGKEQLAKYKQIKDTKVAQISDLIKTEDNLEIVCKNILGVYSLLQQVADGFIIYTDEQTDIWGDSVVLEKRPIRIVDPMSNPKIKAMFEVLDEAGQVVIWAKYVESIKIIEEALSERYGKNSVVTFYGGIDQDMRELNKKKFLSGEAKFFVANPVVGGAGLTLNCANTVVYFDNSFKLIDRLQSEDRCHRIGQKNNVLYVDLIAQDTVDERIIEAIKSKKDLATYVSDKLTIDKNHELW